MVSVFELEKAAARLRRDLRAAALPEIKLLCALRFTALLEPAPSVFREPYLREFTPALAQAAEKSNPREFFPDELEALRKFAALLREEGAWRGAPEALALERLLAQGAQPDADEHSGDGHSVLVNGLFVEHYPELDLAPRGRLLTLRVTATPLHGRVESDDVVVRNPVSEPDDRFLAQARDSVAAARAHLARRFGWRTKKHYRFDFAVDSTGARFTGDSLGVAFAAGAVAALSKIEAFRERIVVHPQVAFCGALSADGILAPVDINALKLKILRGFHSDLKVIVVPRDHITEAWEYVKALEATHPRRQLHIVGYEQLADVLTDLNIVRSKRVWIGQFVARRMYRYSRTARVQAPLLAILLYTTLCLIFPKLSPFFSWKPVYAKIEGHELRVLNIESQHLWTKSYPCTVIGSRTVTEVIDVENDGHAEVLVLLQASPAPQCSLANVLVVYEHDGTLRFSGNCVVNEPYPGEQPVPIPRALDVRRLESGYVIISQVFQENPARLHLRFWSAQGDSLGSYLNAGFVGGLGDDLVAYQDSLLLFNCFNAREDCACAFVLNPTGSYGVSPPYSDPTYPLQNVRRGNQKLYVLFPRTEENLRTGMEYNEPTGFAPNSTGEITIKITQARMACTDEAVTIYYLLRPDLRIESATPDDRYRILRSSLLGKAADTTTASWNAYASTLVTPVKYWTDTGWVTEGALRAAELTSP